MAFRLGLELGCAMVLAKPAPAIHFLVAARTRIHAVRRLYLCCSSRELQSPKDSHMAPEPSPQEAAAASAAAAAAAAEEAMRAVLQAAEVKKRRGQAGSHRQAFQEELTKALENNPEEVAARLAEQADMLEAKMQAEAPQYDQAEKDFYSGMDSADAACSSVPQEKAWMGTNSGELHSAPSLFGTTVLLSFASTAL
eukprot:scaffold63805_cov20-Prasinocladus_malaysianus.AAC.2